MKWWLWQLRRFCSGKVNKDEMVTKDEAELKGKEKEWVEEEVEDPNLREAGKR